ncbi:MAG: hypothetical protein J6O40_02345 [Ruminococcus sp.]|nr:hypothetical protein [Ruminococcus sp.]
MNEKLEKMINDLPIELQEKAKQCKSLEELNDFLADNEIELPEDALDSVSGGGCGEEMVEYCKKCGSLVTTSKTSFRNHPVYIYYCTGCKRYINKNDFVSRPINEAGAPTTPPDELNI